MAGLHPHDVAALAHVADGLARRKWGGRRRLAAQQHPCLGSCGTGT